MGDLPEKIDTPTRAHNVAIVAQEGFGKNAAAYDENRPSYTEDSVKLILEEIVLPKETNPDSLKYEILELGAGTGKLTELIAPKMPSGYRYLASEPSTNFLDCLKSKSLPVDAINGSASSIPLPDNSVQNILCGQCLHWFSNEESLKEIHRVLVPGGKLIPVANIKTYDEGSWMMEFYKQRQVVMKLTGSSTMNWVNTMEWKEALDATGLFKTARHESLPGIKQPGTLDSVLNQLRTISCYNALPEDECQAYLEELKRKILGYPDVNPDDLSVPFSSLLYVFTAN